jgi:uncharacterized protein
MVIQNHVLALRRFIAIAISIYGALNFAATSEGKLNSDGINELTVAVRKCDARGVATLLNAGVNPNWRNRDGTTALMWVGFFLNPPETSKLEIAKLLVAHGADVNARDNYGRSVLSFLATYDLGQVISYLVAKGADDTLDKTGHSALLTAIEGGKTDIVERLLNAGVDPNQQRTIWAAMHYPSDAVRSAMLKSRKFDKKSPLWVQMAAIEGRNETLKQLITMGADINTPGEWNRSALLLAIEKDQTEAAKILLSAGAKTETLSKSGYGSINGETAICLASRKNNSEVLKALIAAKADVNATCGALESAARNGNIDSVAALIKNGADLNDRYTGNWKAIFVVAESDRADIGDALITNGVKADVRDNMDSTPLMVAACHGSIKMIRLLVKRGANLEATNSKRPISDVGDNFIGTPLAWAVYKNQTEAAALLRELGAKK